MIQTYPAGEHPQGGWALYASHLGGYMRRWILWSPFGTARVHHILRSDEGRDVHDHPFSFWSLILRGGYIEHRPGCVCGTHLDEYEDGPCRRYGPGSIVRRKATDLHRLELVGNKPAWTLVLSSKYYRAWGFRLGDGSWVPHEEYRRSYYRDT